jgi:hypothetical protein
VRLAQFITENLEELLLQWEDFALSLLAPGQEMTRLALRDHATQILMAIAKDMRSRQTEVERYVKSQGLAETTEGASETSAATHGVLRQLVGFDLVQLAADGGCDRAGGRCPLQRRRRPGACRIHRELLGSSRQLQGHLPRDPWT